METQCPDTGPATIGKARDVDVEILEPDGEEEEEGDEEEEEVLFIDSTADKSEQGGTGEIAASRYTIGLSVVLYSLCSSTLLVVNKVVVECEIDPSLLLFCQFLSSSLTVRVLRCAKPDLDIELLTWSKAKPFSLAALVFYLCLLSNTMALKYVNVETVIVVRSCSPMSVAALDYCALGRDLPNAWGMVALLAIASGACLYVLVDEGFHIAGYAWLVIYFVSIVTEMVFVKFIVDTVQMSTWTRVYYNSCLSFPLAIASGLVFSNARGAQWKRGALAALLVSCVVSVGISYAAFKLRKLVSATSFTVVGVVCKIFTVLINDLIWTKHSNALGHCGLMFCIGAGVLYEQSKRGIPGAKSEATGAEQQVGAKGEATGAEQQVGAKGEATGAEQQVGKP